MKPYIFAIDSLVTDFTITETTKQIRYRYECDSSNSMLNKLAVGDAVLIFYKNTNLISSELIVEESNDNYIIFRKNFDLYYGVTIDNQEHINKLLQDDIIEITEEEYELYKKELQNNNFSLGKNINNHLPFNNLFHTKLKNNLPRNIIVFGAPGTGKSFKINEDRKKLLGLRADEDYERVTFHPDYSYANFVGTYKPVMKQNSNQTNLDPDTSFILSVLEDKTLTDQQKYDQLYGTFNNNQQLTNLPILMGLICGTEKINTRLADGSASADNNQLEFKEGKTLSKFIKPANMHEPNSSGGISYEYVPGPFMRMYVKAMKNVQDVTNEFDDPRPFLLIIEEINRANVAAVFGEIFQLLDRNDDNVSEYPIQTSEDIRNYLAKELGGNPSDYAQIRIPDNMFIWATMNSADQGVFPMDTAFKRRWDFQTFRGKW